jgi:hypothetical protein
VYRTNYGVMTRVRELTETERELVDREVRTWNDAARRQAMKRPNEARAIGSASALASLVAIVLRSQAVAFAAGSLAFILLYSSILARRQARKIIAGARGPFHPPAEGWRVEEVEVVARSLVVAASDDEDYMLWWLLEVPGGDWFFLDPLMLPASCEKCPFTQLHIVRLVPDGPVIEASWRGESIPRRGATDSSDGYDAAIQAGHTWRPKETSASGVVAASDLPAWIREIVRD